MKPGELVNGRYQLKRWHRFLGPNGSFQAWDVHLEQSVLLTPIQVATNGIAAAAFRLTLSKCQQLTHPGIARIFDVGLGHPTPFVVSELPDGVPLAEYRKYKSSPEALKPIEEQATSAIKHAHARGVLHGGVSEECIFVSTTGRVKIACFGVAPPLGSAMNASADLEGVSRIFKNRRGEPREEFGAFNWGRLLAGIVAVAAAVALAWFTTVQDDRTSQAEQQPARSAAEVKAETGDDPGSGMTRPEPRVETEGAVLDDSLVIEENR